MIARFAAFWPWVASAASGVLLALSFAPVGAGGLAWVALAPLVAAVWFSAGWSRRERLRHFLCGYLCGIFYFAGSLYWLTSVTVPGWGVLGLYLAVYPGLWAVFLGSVARPVPRAGDAEPVWFRSWSNLLAAILAAAAWVGLEWVRGTLFSGFPWNALGVALWQNLPMIQICDLTGVAGVSFLLVLTNVIFAVTVLRLVLEIGRRRMRAHFDFSLTVVAVALVFGYGVRKVFENPPESIELTFAAVQANVPIAEKHNPAEEKAILDLHVRLSDIALAMKPDLLIWPEAATPRPLFLDQASWDAAREVAARHAGDFLLGTVHFDEQGDFNSAALLTMGGQEAQLYHKVHLVPFGEYVPMRGNFPLFAWVVGDLVPEDFDFGPGAETLQLAAKPVRIGTLICFEDTLAYMARAFAQAGAQALVNVTNDAWFLRSAGSEQHRANAVFRSIETRLPMIRCANTGVTCAIDRLGRETHRLQDQNGNTFVESVLFGKIDVPLHPEFTLYTRIGDAFSLACLVLAVGASAAAFLRTRPKANPHPATHHGS